MKVRPFEPDDELLWEEFCGVSRQGTFLHSRKYLSHHGERYLDLSRVVEINGRCVALLPAAQDPFCETRVLSHPGLTYGGLLTDGAIFGEEVVECIREICLGYQASGYKAFGYKPVPFFYHDGVCMDDIYAMFVLRAENIACGLTSLIDLEKHRHLSRRRVRSLAKARKNGVILKEGISYIPDFWRVLRENLQVRYGKQPVHSESEMQDLASKFPDNVAVCVAEYEGNVVAGSVLFETPSVSHSQYVASSELGRRVSAMDLVFDSVIHEAQQRGRRWFDFGISTENSGRTLNNGLYEFKSEFGGSGAVCEQYEINLERL